MAIRPQTAFLSAAFWAVGAFCVYWQTTVIAAAHRFTEVELPLIGTCTQVEAIVLTLSVFWAPLLVLHLILHCYQRVERAQGGHRPRFPGTIGDDEIPGELKVVRVFLFVVLFVWPTCAHVFLTGRAFSHFQIVQSGIVDKPKAEWRSLSGFREIVWFPVKIPEGAGRSDTFWWVNARRTELRESPPDQAALESRIGKAAPADASGASEKRWSRVKVSALWLQPFAFAGAAVLGVLSCLVACINGFHPHGVLGSSYAFCARLIRRLWNRESAGKPARGKD